MVIYIAAVMILGLLLYALANNAKVQEIGRIAFFCGLLVFLLEMASRGVALVR